MRAPKTPAAASNLIYLFSSAPPERPTYKRGVLNALCYPKGHQLELSYQKSYFQPPLFESRVSLGNRKGVFVFVDYKPESDHEFIPIRFVNIVDVAPKEEATRYLDTTRVHVRIELDDLILYDPKWNSGIAALPGRPKPHVSGSPGGRGYYYVIEGRNPFPQLSEVSQRDIWDQITGKVARAKSLSDCVFLSTSYLRPFRDGSSCDLRPYGKEQKAYHLEPNNIYRLDLRVYYPNPLLTGLQREILVRSSSDVLSVSQPFATAHGTEDHSVLIACKRTIESSLATLVVDVSAKNGAVGSSQNFGQLAAATDVVAAKPLYLLSIEPSRLVVCWFVILIFLGFLLTSTSKEFYSDWVCFPTIWAVVSKTAGAFCLAWAGFLAFKKLPSGGSG
jgi:hypothetical protein